jgi:AraC family transcriptional regulator of adaptative response/methylated-DNA-[protein]-cysteine methyltransferase
MNTSFASEADRWRAVRRRDSSADRYFFYSVRTTGVFCRPSCAARLPRRENVAFHESRSEAERAGFRPCKRCRPELPARSEREAALIAKACRAIEDSQEQLKLKDLAAQFALSPHHFHRLFKRITGVTPGAYAAEKRKGRVQDRLLKGSAVTEAMYESGFNSSGRFYESAPSMLGMKPTAYLRRGKGENLWYGMGRSSLGQVLVAATQRGICAILLGDSKAELLEDLKSRFSEATLCPPPDDFGGLVNRVVSLVDDPGRRASADLPLDIRGTAFQRLVWKALRETAPGTTTTYSKLASRMGRPKAVRAVASACAANPLAVAIPCHRVLASDGSLAGYRWGLERKRTLIEREKK